MVDKGVYFNILNEYWGDVFELVQDVVFYQQEERHFKEYILGAIMNENYIPYNEHIREVFKINQNTIEDVKELQRVEDENIKALGAFVGGEYIGG